MRDIHKISVLLILSLVVSCNVERDRTDAEAVASRVHSQIQARDFAAIYREAAPRFKGVGSESQFVSMMQRVSEEGGIFKKAEEVVYQTGFDSNIGRTHMLFFNVEYENGHSTERMILTRSGSGQMQLWKIEFGPSH